MGNLTLNGATSGQITLAPTAVAGTNTITLPAATGTVLTTAGGQTISGTVTLSTLTSPAATSLTIQSAGTTAMTINTSQNVGIGTSSPAAKLDVLTTASTRLLFTERSTGGNVIDSVNGSNTAYAQFLLNGSPLIFATGATERMRIDSSGYVFMGLTSGNTGNNILTVARGITAQDSSGPALQLYNTGAGTNQKFFRIFSDTSGNTDFQRVNDAYSAVTTNFMRIDSSGDVGIGTTAPSTKLHVVGEVTATQGVGGYPAFNAYASAAQTVSSTVITKIAINTENFDTNNNFDTTNNRFTPTVEGYYQVNGTVLGTGATTFTALLVFIYKNGANIRRTGLVTSLSAGSNSQVSVSEVIYMNGTTDYIELYGQINGTGTLQFAFSSSVTTSSFSACLVRGA